MKAKKEIVSVCLYAAASLFAVTPVSAIVMDGGTDSAYGYAGSAGSADQGEWQAAMPLPENLQGYIGDGLNLAPWKGTISEKGQEMAGFLLEDLSELADIVSAENRTGGSLCYYEYDTVGFGCSTTRYQKTGKEIINGLRITGEGYTVFGMDVYVSLEDFKKTAESIGFE